MFLSKHYATKMWTNHERDATQARAFEERREYILPARFDKTKILGINPTVGCVDLRIHTAEEFAKLIIDKICTRGGETARLLHNAQAVRSKSRVSVIEEADVVELAEMTWDSQAYQLQKSTKQARDEVRKEHEQRGTTGSGLYWSSEADIVVTHLRRLVEACIAISPMTRAEFLLLYETNLIGIMLKKPSRQDQNSTFEAP